MKIIFAFLLAPLSAGIVGATWAILIGASDRMPTMDELVEAAWLGFKLGAFVSYCTAFTLGVVGSFLLWFFRRVSLTDYVVSGFVLGFVVFEITWPGFIRTMIYRPNLFSDPEGLGMLLELGAYYALPCGIAGASSAVVFWLIARPEPRIEKKLSTLS